MINQDELKQLLHYDPISGIFTWKERDICNFKNIKHFNIWNTLYSGKVAGSKHNCGYIQIVLKTKHYLAHRLAWLYFYGFWPVKYLDHINHDRSDNRICNLREATATQNSQNKIEAMNTKTSKYLGVHKRKDRGKFCAQITINGVKKTLGCFNTQEDAYNAYLKAKRELHEFCTI